MVNYAQVLKASILKYLSAYLSLAQASHMAMAYFQHGSEVQSYCVPGRQRAGHYLVNSTNCYQGSLGRS